MQYQVIYTVISLTKDRIEVKLNGTSSEIPTAKVNVSHALYNL